MNNNHKVMIKIKEYVKCRNAVFLKNERDLTRINMLSSNDTELKRVVLGSLSRFRKYEEDLRQLEIPIINTVNEYITKHKIQLNRNFALYLLKKYMGDHINLKVFKKDPNKHLNDNIEINNEFISEVIILNN